MAFAIRMSFDGVDASQYLAVHREVVNTIKPKGVLLHTAGEVDGTWQIFDIWESAAAFDAFTQQLLPVIQEQGITVKPTVTVTELYNVWTPGLSTLDAIGSDPMPVAVGV